MSSFFVDLNHLDLMSVKGKDSVKFLQGQLSCDIESLTNNQSCLGASCDNKGRVLSSFRLVKVNDTFLLEMQPGIIGLLQPILEKYGVFYQSEISDAASQYQRFGMVGDKSYALLSKKFPTMPASVNQAVYNEGKVLIKLSDSPLRFELWIENSSSNEALLGDIKQNLDLGTSSAWHLLDMQAGLYYIQQEDSGLYTPQVLNYDLAGFINFSKGCYTGQEIVARMHYRGKAKKRLYRLQIHSEKNISEDDLLNSPASKKIETVFNIQKISKDAYEALAILKIDFEEAKALKNLDLQDKQDISIEITTPTY